MTHLQALYDAVKAGDSIAISLRSNHMDTPLWWHFRKAIKGNTQAAIDFVQAVLPGARWQVGSDASVISIHGLGGWDAPSHGNPARALLLAALAAMIAKGEG